MTRSADHPVNWLCASAGHCGADDGQQQFLKDFIETVSCPDFGKKQQNHPPGTKDRERVSDRYA